jgi:hypothetical protein
MCNACFQNWYHLDSADCGYMDCDSVQSSRWLATSWMNVSPPSSGGNICIVNTVRQYYVAAYFLNTTFLWDFHAIKINTESRLLPPWRQYSPLKRRSTSRKLRRAVSQKASAEESVLTGRYLTYTFFTSVITEFRCNIKENSARFWNKYRVTYLFYFVIGKVYLVIAWNDSITNPKVFSNSQIWSLKFLQAPLF